jgi:hypothetical protein
VTARIADANIAYNIYAVLSLDLLMSIFWLACMGANAGFRGEFSYSSSDSYYDKRAYTANRRGLDEISAIAGLSALMM